MATFTKKPIAVEALQWDGTEAGAHLIQQTFKCTVDVWHDFMYIITLEGKMRTIKGDWVIKGVRGEVYPCKRDIFEQTYEAA